MASTSVRCPSCAGTEGIVRNGKSTAGHQCYLCKQCRKTWQLTFTYSASRPGTPGDHRYSLGYRHYGYWSEQRYISDSIWFSAKVRDSRELTE